MKHNKKGIASEIYFVLSLIIITVVFSTMLVNIFSSTKELDIEQTKDTYTLINALKTAKIYTESSLDFSVYQAVYSNSMHGGYYDISQLPASQKLTNGLMPLCQNEMKRYTGCGQAGENDGKTIYAGLKNDGKHYNVREVGLLQCILAKMRDKDTGELYYEMKDENTDSLKQIDCNFGTITEKAMMGFQQDYSLKATGEVDSETLEKLKQAFALRWGDCSKFFGNCTDDIKTIVYWPSLGAPSEQKILDEFKNAVKNELARYTAQDYSFMKEYVKLPAYGESGIKIERGSESNLITVSLTSEEMFSVIKEDKQSLERINMRISPDIRKEYPIRYFDFYDIAAKTLQDVGNEAKRKDCASYIAGDKIMHNEFISGFIIDAEVFDVAEPCSLTARVTIKDDTRAYPVYTGKEVSFEPITFEFLTVV